jgi:hypothetical protein
VHVLQVRIGLESDERLDTLVVLAPRCKHQRRLQAVALPAAERVHKLQNGRLKQGLIDV